MIEIRNLTKRFKVTDPDGSRKDLVALDSVTLDIESGKIISLLGPTGCGKSTFLEILAGLQHPTSGSVLIDGISVLDAVPDEPAAEKAYRTRHRFLPAVSNGLFRDRQRRNIAMVFQDYAVFPWMNVLENVTFTMKLRGIRSDQREELAIEFLTRVGLEDSLYKYPSQLSGGMRQRLALARALSVEPEIILMDEPFSSVDAAMREQLQDLLLSLWTSSGATIVLITHSAEEAVYLSDEVVLFSPQPGTVRTTISVDLPRPRVRRSAGLKIICDSIENATASSTVVPAE